MYIIPKPGLRVMWPLSRRPLPPEGADVPENSYWIRRLRDGDAELADKPPEPIEAQFEGEPE